MVHPRVGIFLRLFSVIRRFGGDNTADFSGRASPGFSPLARNTSAALAVIVLSAFPIVAAARNLGADGIVSAPGPVDHHRAGHGRSWDLLQAAADHVPAGSSFTVRAPTRLKEMHLFMIAIGQLRGRHALPSSYFKTPLPHIGGRARYVLVLAGTQLPAEPDLELVASTHTGSVFRRGDR